MPGERIDKWLDFLEHHPDNPYAKAPMNIFRSPAEAGLKATPGADGLRLRDINIGSYGVVPDTWTLQNDAPRGTESTGQIIPAAYSIFDKAEVWSENAVDLYEEAIKHRWTPATDLDWEGGLSDLPEELERAVGQICTVYSNNGLVEQKIIGKWLEQISYGYHEPKLFLATQAFDAGRKVEALRKRALINGGGLGQAPAGSGLSRLVSGADLHRHADRAGCDLHVLRTHAVRVGQRVGADAARTRHVRAAGARFAPPPRLRAGPPRVVRALQAERRTHAADLVLPLGGRLISEMRLSTAEREALVVLFGGGVENLSAGVERLKTLRQRQYDEYIANLASINFDRPSPHPGLASLAENPLEGGTVVVRAVARE